MTVYVCMPYYSNEVLSLVKPYLQKIRYNCVKTCSIRFKIQHDVSRIKFHCNTKDKTAAFHNSFVVYNISFPGCGANYIGKTEKTYERKVEHAWTDDNSVAYKYLNDCTGVQHLVDISLCTRHCFRNHDLFRTVTNSI